MCSQHPVVKYTYETFPIDLELFFNAKHPVFSFFHYYFISNQLCLYL